jgi:predicted transposase/invertase (TIGR01784 family)
VATLYTLYFTDLLLNSGGKAYKELPRVIIISIVSFKLFDCAEYHSEFQLLEVTRHVLLTNRLVMHFYELLKLPKEMSADDEERLWLILFHAETEEDLGQIEALGVPIMNQAIEAYRNITASKEFQTLERMRSDARRNEASALYNARLEGQREESEKWRKIVEDKDAALAAALADKDAEIARLRELLGGDR